MMELLLHCDWYSLHSVSDKLLYGHVPDPFPQRPLQANLGMGPIRLCMLHRECMEIVIVIMAVSKNEWSNV